MMSWVLYALGGDPHARYPHVRYPHVRDQTEDVFASFGLSSVRCCALHAFMPRRQSRGSFVWTESENVSMQDKGWIPKTNNTTLRFTSSNCMEFAMLSERNRLWRNSHAAALLLDKNLWITRFNNASICDSVCSDHPGPTSSNMPHSHPRVLDSLDRS
jgi:hypothetical protein